MRVRVPLFAVLILASMLTACAPGETPSGTTGPEDAGVAGPGLPEIVARAIEFHGGALYERSRMAMTITSLSGSFQIETTREDGVFEHIITGAVGPERVERRVRLTNDSVQEWRDGVETALDAEGERRARAYADARVFFPLLPYTLKGGDIHFEDRGLETWNGKELRRVYVSFSAGTSNDADDAYTFWFDPETGRIDQFGYDFDGGLRFRKATAFNRVGGVLFSDQENYAVDGGKVPVDTLTPEYVENEMELLSTVVISDITVDPL